LKNFKKTLLIAAILCVLAGLFSVYNLIQDLSVEKISKFEVGFDILQIALSFITSIIYLFFSFKSNEYVLKCARFFYTICFVNIFNSIIAWVITFWVEITIGKFANKIRYTQILKRQQNFDELNTGSDIVDMSEEDYEINKTTDILSKRLNELKTAYENNEISEQEYEQLKDEVIKKYMN